MSLKFKITELFRGKFPNPQNLYAQLQDLDRQIEEGADAVPIVKKDVNLTKTALKKAFGDPTLSLGASMGKSHSLTVFPSGDTGWFCVKSPQFLHWSDPLSVGHVLQGFAGW